MILKFTLTILGDNFWPDKLVERLTGKFLLIDKNNPDDKKFQDREEIYGHGAVSFWHPQKFTLQDNIFEYEEWFVGFLENNYGLMVQYGAEDFHLFLEIYYSGDQCNFEIFDKILLKRITQFNISLPISVYRLEEQELQDWEKEIELNGYSSRA